MLPHMRWLVLLVLPILLVACTQSVQADLAAIHAKAAMLSASPTERLSSEIDAAQRLAESSGIADVRDAMNRLAEAAKRPDTPGGVQIVIEPTRLPEQMFPISPATRTVRLRPALRGNRVIYLLRIDSDRTPAVVAGTPEFLLLLYAASLRRDFYESLRTSKAVSGPQLLDAILNEPDGQLAALYRTWPAVVQTGYLPMKAAGLIQPLPAWEEMASALARCGNHPDKDRCWRDQIRAEYNLN